MTVTVQLDFNVFSFCTIDAVFAISAIAFIILLSFQPVRSF